MKNIFKNLKKKKGFTLVEVIIVLVIIAILAAVLIPSLAGYIDKANQKVAVANARNFTMAAQTIGSEMYGGGKIATMDATAQTKFITDALELAELDKSYLVAVTMTSKGKITKVNFLNGGFLVTYENGKFLVDKSGETKPTAQTVTIND